MKKFNFTSVCFVCLILMYSHTIFAQNLALNINLSNVEQIKAKSTQLMSYANQSTYSLLNTTKFSTLNQNTYYDLFTTRPVNNGLSVNPTASIMFKQPMASSFSMSFRAFSPTNGSLSGGGNGNFSWNNVLDCTNYSTSNTPTTSLSTYYGNGSSAGTPVLNGYYNGGTRNNNVSVQPRSTTITTNAVNNFVGLKRVKQ